MVVNTISMDDITVDSNVPAFYVQPEVGVSGKFSESGFLLLPDVSRTISFTPEKTTDLEELQNSLNLRDLRSTY